MDTNVELHRTLPQARLEARDEACRKFAKFHAAGRRLVLDQLDARQTEQIVDQPVHPRRLLTHDREESLLRGRIIGGGAAQRVDEADERRERCAQLVTDVGDEIGTHAFHRAFACAIRQHDDGAAAISYRRIHRHHRGMHLARHGHRQRHVRRLGRSGGERTIDRGAKLGMSQHCWHVRTERGACGGIRAPDAAIRGKHDQRIRQALDNGTVSAAKLLDECGTCGGSARQSLEIAGETLHARKYRRLTGL